MACSEPQIPGSNPRGQQKECEPNEHGTSMYNLHTVLLRAIVMGTILFHVFFYSGRVIVYSSLCIVVDFPTGLFVNIPKYCINTNDRRHLRR